MGKNFPHLLIYLLNYFYKLMFLTFSSMQITFFFDCISSMWKFQGQRSNLCHSCDLSHSCSNTRPLTCCTTQELLRITFEYINCITPALTNSSLLGKFNLTFNYLRRKVTTVKIILCWQKT